MEQGQGAVAQADDIDKGDWRTLTDLDLFGLLGSHLTLSIEDGTQRNGFLYTADPESGSVVLLQAPICDQACAMLDEMAVNHVHLDICSSKCDVQPWRLVNVFSRSIRDYLVGPQTCPISAAGLFSFGQLLAGARGGIHRQGYECYATSSTTIAEQKRSVITLLQECRVPFAETDDGSLLVLGSVLVSAPFTAKQRDNARKSSNDFDKSALINAAREKILGRTSSS